MNEFPTRYDAHKRGRFSTLCNDTSLTKQSFKEECDINRIMARYLATGVPPPAGVKTALYGDFTLASDYFEAKMMVVRANQQFASLPAKVRDRFSNDPSQLLEFVSNRDNLAEARALGLLKDEAEPTPPAPAKGAPATPPEGKDGVK